MVKCDFYLIYYSQFNYYETVIKINTNYTYTYNFPSLILGNQ